MAEEHDRHTALPRPTLREERSKVRM
jgi:hypothetical protein